MRATLLCVSIAALVAGTNAAAQSSDILPLRGLSIPRNPTISTPDSAPANPSISSMPPGLSTSIPPTLSVPPLPSIGDTFPLPPFLTDPLGSVRSPNPTGSPFADQASFLSRQGGLTSTLGVSSSLLDSLSQPIELFERDSVRPAPAVGISSGATLGGSQPFDEFCRPEDFTCD